jgi:hypothetical protein
MRDPRPRIGGGGHKAHGFARSKPRFASGQYEESLPFYARRADFVDEGSFLCFERD